MLNGKISGVFLYSDVSRRISGEYFVNVFCCRVVLAALDARDEIEARGHILRVFT